jgi:hypothetical protein
VINCDNLKVISSLVLLLDEQLVSLVDPLREKIIVGHEPLNLLNRQVDQHTSDLGGQIPSHHSSHEVKDAGADSLSVAGIYFLDCRIDLHRLRVEITCLGVLRSSQGNLLGRHRLGLGHLLLVSLLLLLVVVRWSWLAGYLSVLVALLMFLVACRYFL